MEIVVTGGEGLARLGVELKAAGRNDLRKELLTGFRVTTRTLPPKIRASAAETLPQSGGLAALVVAALKVSIANRLAGRNVGVRIRGVAAAPLRRLNAGTVRHPRFGDKTQWYTESVTPGWFDNPIKENATQIELGLNASMARVAAKLEAV